MIRLFEAAGLRLGEDPGGLEGARRIQFRRYVAGANQHDPQQLDRLGIALGAFIGEVAESKIEYLVNAAKRDGFTFADGVFKPAAIAVVSFAVTSVEDMVRIDDRAQHLRLLANDRPSAAIAGAMELLESLCTTVLQLLKKPDPKRSTNLATIVKATVDALHATVANTGDADAGFALVRTYVGHASIFIANCDEQRGVIDPRTARLVVGTAVSLAGFIAETCLAVGTSRTRRP